MENGEIRDDQITASSYHSEWYRPFNARLNYALKGWAARTNDLNQWLRVDFQQPANITGISTQGQQIHYVVFVTNYTISFSDDGNNFQGYNEEGVVKVR